VQSQSGVQYGAVPLTRFSSDIYYHEAIRGHPRHTRAIRPARRSSATVIST